ncbi:HD domain-containing protein, partial [bacterium]|nr:HD domain-containing protein [bacterium]
MKDTTMNDLLKRIECATRSLFDGESSGHDINHLKRTKNLALHIQEIEGGDPLVLAAAALLHDVHRLKQSQTGVFCSPEASLPQVLMILREAQFPSDKIGKVLHCVQYHEEYSFSANGRTVDDIETLILQDADNLDAMGAIGIGRTFLFGGAHQVPMWAPEIPLPKRD